MGREPGWQPAPRLDVGSRSQREASCQDSAEPGSSSVSSDIDLLSRMSEWIQVTHRGHLPFPACIRSQSGGCWCGPGKVLQRPTDGQKESSTGTRQCQAGLAGRSVAFSVAAGLVQVWGCLGHHEHQAAVLCEEIRCIDSCSCCTGRGPCYPPLCPQVKGGGGKRGLLWISGGSLAEGRWNLQLEHKFQVCVSSKVLSRRSKLQQQSPG